MPDQNMTQLIKDFIIHLCAAGRATSTIACCQQELDQLAWYLGDIHPGRITEKDVDHVVAGIATANRNGRRGSAATMNRIKSACRSFLSWAFGSKRIPCNPADRLRRTKAYSRPTTPITAEDITVLLQTIRQSGDIYAERDEALFATYAYTGLRRSEALSLTLQDYDRDCGALSRSQAKNGGKQMRIVPSVLADILAKRVRVAQREHGISLDQLLIFPRKSGAQPISARHVQVRFDKWKKLVKHSFFPSLSRFRIKASLI